MQSIDKIWLFQKLPKNPLWELLNYKTLNKTMKIIRAGFEMIEFNHAVEALQYSLCRLIEGKGSFNTQKEDSFYIWTKDSKYYTEVPNSYHTAERWRNSGYKTFDIVRIIECTKKYFYDTKEKKYSSFTFNGSKYRQEIERNMKTETLDNNESDKEMNKKDTAHDDEFNYGTHYGEFAGSYAQDEMGYIDDVINDAFEGDPNAYRNVNS